MAMPAPSHPAPTRLSAERYLALVDEGVLGPEDRVELLEGVVVSMSPQNPLHAATVSLVYAALAAAVGTRAAVRSQLSFVAGPWSVPEPDIVVVPGTLRDYARAHPSTALLVVEVADTSLPTDRLTKAAIYAAAEIPEYWIVNVRDGRVEVHRDPDASVARYRDTKIAVGGERLALVALPDVAVGVADLLP
jgi:Uma2 family endonuclease